MCIRDSFYSNLKLLKLVQVFLIFQSRWSGWYFCYNNSRQTNHVLCRSLLRPQMINSWAMRSIPKNILESSLRNFRKGKEGKNICNERQHRKTFKPSRIILDFVCFPQRVLFTVSFREKTINMRMKQRFPWQSPKINWFMVLIVYPPNFGCIWVFFKH